MGQVFSIYCNLRKNRYRTEVCVFLRLLVPEKNLSHLSLGDQVPKILPEKIGAQTWADTDQGPSAKPV